MQELVFSAAEIFDSTTTKGCLYQYECKNYLVPAYQRGYKWASEKIDDPVPRLLSDLLTAFNRKQNDSRKGEYYLQYITVKKLGESLEVIDGQQRLTTLSLIFSVLSLLDENIPEIATHKLEYAIRDSFFATNIYDKERLSALLAATWSNNTGLVLPDGNYDTQDIYYIFHAVKRIKDFFTSNPKSVEGLSNFIRNDVKIIVNAVEEHVPSEDVFKNLNSKKIPLTEVDLVKALFITRIARLSDHQESMRYQEIMELRSKLGKHWDEISLKMRDEAFTSFYFRESLGIYSLLHLLAVSKGYKEEKDVSKNTAYPLFNFYNDQNNLLELFDLLKLYYSVLQEWYMDTKVYNLLGFIFYLKGAGMNKTDFLIRHIMKSKQSLLESAFKVRKELLNTNLDMAKYGESEMLSTLLAMSVFTVDKEKMLRFDFYSFKEEEWSLEHIFPQTPEGKGQTLNSEQRALVLEMLGGDKASDKIKLLLAKEVREPEEKEEYYAELQKNSSIHSIGNMALLSLKDNASLGCNMFAEKRGKVLDLVRNGSFVPKHTFDVFSKIILGKRPGNLLMWTGDNIRDHQTAITDFITKLNTEQTNAAG